MINWELPHEKVACPHCGSTETQVTLQLLGVIRFTCQGCRKSFAVQDGNTSSPRTEPKRSPTESSTQS